eukprot:CAMPEP_0117081192 /NCGR_PEP_ID=MMETSP0472-20121206/57242_1 /TAXON_ID=693140 ORGANISM="Tiarina fusus, Strain LIS" /NCGR_SAMPLE_ID=MMETSP0472 /ASSEMBLY_ACC=CAM_ASM_000603 /LENGTH=352 /DNA_ID=CAMNT_0004809055 /DNA_START=80 /DNA_END=1135 /DNA_ORIENTATION=+
MSICSVSLLSVSSLYAQLVVIPKLLRKGRNKPTTPWDARAPLLPWSLCSLLLMAVASALLTSSSGDSSSSDLFPRDLSSSINFCEDDFQDSDYIAEPANTASSIASYCPLALLGLFGPPSTEWSTRVAGNTRFAIAYAALFAIGVGSTLLHALLTAKAQGGDELPMLWFMAALSFSAIDVILNGKWGPVKDSRTYLQLLVSTSAVMATGIYVFSRASFLHFYIMFAVYSYIACVGVIVICFNVKWNDDDFRANVLLPLGVSAAWVAVLAVVSWVSEMLFCEDSKTWTALPLAPWIWNRAVHPLWHISSALLAWLLTQIILAAQGMQHGWGEPRLKWFGAPYVTFYKPQHPQQ